MKRAYPVFMKEVENDVVLVRVPDFDSVTEGYGLVDAIEMARDLIGVMGICCEDKGEVIPEPCSVQVSPEDGEFKTFIDIDFVQYRAMTDNRLVKKNCTIPYYLEYAAEKAGLNFSRVLSEALAEKLNLHID